MMVKYIRAGLGNPQGFLQIIAFYYPGSSCSLNTLSLAEQLNLLGQDIMITIQTVNRAKVPPTKLFVLTTESRSSDIEYVQAFWVENISSDVHAVNVSSV